MLDEIALKIYTKTKKVIDRGNKSKTLNEVKPVKNIYKNSQSFLEILREALRNWNSVLI